MRPNIRPGARHVRTYQLDAIEVRSASDGQPARVSGHAAVYNRWSVDLGGFKERVLPGAFQKSLGVSDVRALFNHDPNYVMGRTASGTLELSDQSSGLKFDCEPPDTQTMRDLVLTPLGRGDISQCSFSFQVRGDQLWDPAGPIPAGTGSVWRSPRKDGGLYERDLLDLELFDVSVVTFPAYPQTDASVRSALADRGIRLDDLEECLTRNGRGLPLTAADVELLTGSIEALRSLLPEADGEEPSGANAGEASRKAGGPSRAQLMRDLEHRLRIAGAAA